MSDIDDELLALAGGDVSSGEEEEPMDMSRDDSRSPSPAPASSREKDASARGVAVKKTAAKKKGRASRSDDESEDEGQASSPPASPGSQMSAPMDESDSDSDVPQNRARSADDESPYPIEGLFKSYEEKARIMSMREIEREQILAERREENERIRQNRMLRQLKVNQEKDSKKRKASAADLEDATRKPSRARTKAGESSDKMDTLRRAREERSNRKEQRERENDRRRQRSPSYRRSRSPDDDDDDDSDKGWRRDSRRKSGTPDSKEAPPAELRDVERVRLGRTRFAEVCFYPGFEEAITGCYVRINIGPDPTTRQDVYRMAVIKGFTQGRPYAITDRSGHQIVVDMYVKAAHGKAQREWPFITCSDKAFTEAEWNRYKQVCLAEGVPVPTKPVLVAKIADINGLIERTWTDQEVSEKLKRQNALHIKYSGIQRDNVAKQLELARARGDEEAVARLQEKLDNLEVPRLAFRTTPAAANGSASASGSATPKAGQSAELLPHIAKLQEQQRSQAKPGVPVIHKPLMDDDIIGALDLDIDVEID
ncbi:hypothetical protein VTH06DRAFT_7324 [Thermothelomyces fergusii]